MGLIYGTFYKHYVNKVHELSISEALEQSKEALLSLLQPIETDGFAFTYAPEKWSIAQLVQHIIDTEAVFYARALWMVRSNIKHYQGFEQDEWVRASSQSTILNKSDLIKAFLAQRQLTELLYSSLTETDLAKKALASGYALNVRAIPYILSGHVYHHVDVLNERYLAALNS